MGLLYSPHHAAIEQQVLTRDVRGLVGEQERHSLREFLEPPDSPHRDRLQDLLTHWIGSTNPGRIEFTRIPCGAPASACTRVHAESAARKTLETGRTASGCFAA